MVKAGNVNEKHQGLVPVLVPILDAPQGVRIREPS